MSQYVSTYNDPDFIVSYEDRLMRLTYSWIDVVFTEQASCGFTVSL